MSTDDKPALDDDYWYAVDKGEAEWLAEQERIIHEIAVQADQLKTLDEWLIEGKYSEGDFKYDEAKDQKQSKEQNDVPF